MSSEFQIKGIGQVSIRVHNMEVATRFYQETLGLNMLFQITNMAFFECNGIRIILSIPEGPEFDHPSSVFYFNVDNISSAYDTLINRNVQFLSKPHKIAEMGQTETWMAFFHDPDQNVHALMSEVPVSK
ncbi:VOC family protein [Paenibacillus lautus]|uniref:VOC family protein n=1 Tax=Paenibacillus TaxID=44249 RepID=UPI0010D75331|nr:VOC family protein [Paenibacillus sp. BR1-192]MBY0158743.1 VOC family protein [Cytobacillus firmus]WFB56870.1 VOC family protein [Paenibacillus sp. BR1-192]VTR43849.1 Glyoxalase-like domain [Actinobacillus pleuropneumoniae]